MGRPEANAALQRSSFWAMGEARRSQANSQNVTLDEGGGSRRGRAVICLHRTRIRT